MTRCVLLGDSPGRSDGREGALLFTNKEFEGVFQGYILTETPVSVELFGESVGCDELGRNGTEDVKYE